MRYAFDSRSRRGYVLYHILTYKQGIHGIQHQKVWLPHDMAPCYGCRTDDHVETDLKGKDLLFIAGGIGLAPLRSVINYVRDKRENYGSIQVIYGSRSKDDLVDYQEILDEWMADDGVEVNLTIDNPQEGWDGHVGFVPNYVKELAPSTNKTVLVCGPPIMIKFTLAGLKEIGFTETQVYTTMELRMKCAVGKCGRCNIGNKYVCKDGPVFRFDQLGELPDEY